MNLYCATVAQIEYLEIRDINDTLELGFWC